MSFFQAFERMTIIQDVTVGHQLKVVQDNAKVVMVPVSKVMVPSRDALFKPAEPVRNFRQKSAVSGKMVASQKKQLSGKNVGKKTTKQPEPPSSKVHQEATRKWKEFIEVEDNDEGDAAVAEEERESPSLKGIAKAAKEV